MVNKTVMIQFPPGFYGGDPQSFLDEAGLQLRRRDGNFWAVCTVEAYLRQQRPSLITASTLSGPRAEPGGFDLISQATSQMPFTQDFRQEMAKARDMANAEAVARRDMVSVAHSWQVQLHACSDRDLPALARSIDEIIGQTPTPTRPQAFPTHGSSMVRRDPMLGVRARLPTVLLHVAQDPTVFADYGAGALPNEPIFAAAQSLLEGYTLPGVYIAPLLGALSPYVWGFDVTRSFGALLMNFGADPILGIGPDPTELLHLLRASSSLPTGRLFKPVLSDTSAGEATNFWVARLNEMFAVLSDPVNFASKTNLYEPQAHHHWMLTVEQVFRRVASVQTGFRDDTVGRVLMFSVLDAMTMLNGLSFDDMCTLSLAEKVAASLRGQMPSDVAQVLMPGADRAVAALRSVQDGFFIRRRRGSGGVELNMPDGTEQKRTLELGVAQLLKALRNATHGFGGGSEAIRPQSAALLAHHDTAIPKDLELLAYLYLLDLLVDRTRLARRTSSSSSRQR